MRRCLVLVVAAVPAVGCMFEKHSTRPTRFLLGANARDLAGSENGVALRQTSPSEALPREAITASGQFTQRFRQLFACGFELETGRLGTDGGFAGAYGVLGADHATHIGSIGVELVGGWRGLRHRFGADRVDTFVAEPRMRAQLRIASQISLGGVVGATLGEAGSWMAGLYLGIYSDSFGR